LNPIFTPFLPHFNPILDRNVQEPKLQRVVGSELHSSTESPFTRVYKTWTSISQYKDLTRFIAAGFFIGEGSGVIFHMSVIYAVTVCKISYSTILMATIFNRVSGIFFALGWGHAVQGKWFGPNTPQRCYTVVIVVLTLSCGLCAVLEHAWQYWLLAALLSLAGTGAFSFSRSLLSSLCPPDKASEIFGYSAMIGHIAGFVGPLLFATVVHYTAQPRSGFGVILLLLMIGGILFYTTDFDKGQELANGQPYANLADFKTIHYLPEHEAGESQHLMSGGDPLDAAFEKQMAHSSGSRSMHGLQSRPAAGPERGGGAEAAGGGIRPPPPEAMRVASGADFTANSPPPNPNPVVSV